MTNPDFALQWLNYLGTKIYSKGKRIFEYQPGPEDYKISAMSTYIRPGVDFSKFIGDVRMLDMPFSELFSRGYIVTRNSDFKWRDRQSYYYRLQTRSVDAIGITQEEFKKEGMNIQHEPDHRRFRLTGRNVLASKEFAPDSGVGPWIQYDLEERRGEYYKDLNSKEKLRSMLDRIRGVKSNIEVALKYIKDDIPVLLSQEGYVVCLPREKTCQRIIVVGEPGTGKSIMTNGWGSRVGPYGIWQDRTGWLIDPMNQFYDLSLPQEYEEFNELNSLIGNAPRPNPAVQLYLSGNSQSNIVHDKISIKVVQNFYEFLKKYKFYTFGIKDWDLQESYKYLPDYINALKDAKNGEDVVNAMKAAIPDYENNKGMQQMAYKWKNTLQSVLDEKFTSNLYTEDNLATDELEVEFKDGRRIIGHPFIMCYEAGLVPVLNISSVKHKRWIRNYLADLMNKVVAHQIEMGNNQHRVWIIADELNEIYEKGKRRDNASAAFENLERQGRYNNLGFIGNTQSLKKLNPEMYDAATHICCTYMKDMKSRKMIADTYDLPEVSHLIESLREREMIIFSKHPFITYDRWGNRKKVVDRCWFKGRIFPPTNYHKIPPQKGGK